MSKTWLVAFDATAVLLAAGAGAWVAVADPRYSIAAVGLMAALAVGFTIAHIVPAGWLAGLACIAAVTLPRVVQRDFPEPWFTTVSGPRLALLAAVLIGAALARSTADERRVVAVPSVLSAIGYALSPGLLVEPTMAMIASSGALYVCGRKRRGWLLLLGAWMLGVASIFWRVPGYQGEIAVLDSGIRVFGIFGNPLIAADSLVLMGGALLALWWRHAIVCLALVGITVAAVIETGSRTGVLLVGVVTLAVILGAFPVRREHRVAGRRVLTLALGGAAVYTFLVSGVELGRIGSISGEESSFAARAASLLGAGPEALSRPVGGGSINYATTAGNLTSYENIFFDTAARYGWFPLAALVVALVMVGRRSSTPALVQLLILILAGMTAAVTYFPAVWMVGLISVGVVEGASAQRRDDDVTPVEGSGRASVAGQHPS